MWRFRRARLNTAIWGVLTAAQREQLTKLRAERQTAGEPAAQLSR